VCGDFNAVPRSEPLRRFAAATGLGSIRPYGLDGTWPAATPALRVPIDNCLVSERLSLLGRRVGPHIRSDHLPLVVDLGLHGADMG
jgi:endonuclease/exonuclease/phosphatase (EEP) superfamily protein YafD